MYRQRSTGWMKHWDFILLDLIALHLSFVIAYWVRHGIANPYLRQEYQEISLVLLCTDLIILFFMESLRGVIYRGYWKELVKCVQSAVLITLVTTWYLFSIKAGAEYSRLVCYMTGGFYVIFNYGLYRLETCSQKQRNVAAWNGNAGGRRAGVHWFRPGKLGKK